MKLNKIPVLAALLLGLSLLTTSSFADTVLIDVRTPEEFADGHIEGAINIPHDQIGESIKALELDKDTDIELYCRSGRRAGVALQTLEDLGYSRLENRGGYEALAAEMEACEPGTC